MATTKKSAPAAAKKAPPNLKVFKKTEIRTDYKPGTRVKVTRRTGEFKGFVTGHKDTPTGRFLIVNIGTKQVPIIHEARPAKVRGF
jgi:hypothetical protein